MEFSTTTFIFEIVILIFSIVIHEVSHGYAANILGDKTAELEGRLTLNPIKHMDLLGSVIVPTLAYISGGFIIGWAKPVPFNPYNLRSQKWGEAIVAFAGPASNLLIATIFGLILRFTVNSVPASFSVIVGYVVLINLTLAVFNLVPIPPLDGSKILFTFLPFYSKTRAFLEQHGLILALFFMFYFWRYIQPIVTFLFRFITGLPV